MYDNFKIANYSNTLLSPELYARPLSRLFKGEVIDGFTVIPGAGLQVILNPGNAFVRYGSTNVASARIVSLVADFALTIATPDASNPRIDSVVLYVDMAETLPVVDANNPPTAANLDGPGVAKAIIVSGTPAAVPVKPTATAIQSAAGAGNPYIVLGSVTVDPGVSVIAAGKIADARNFAKVGSSNIESATPTTTPASGGAFTGDWYKRQIANGAYRYTFSAVATMSLGANTWAHDRFLNLPDGISFNGSRMGISVSIVTEDSVVVTTAAIDPVNAGRIRIDRQNKTTSVVSTVYSINVILDTYPT